MRGEKMLIRVACVAVLVGAMGFAGNALGGDVEVAGIAPGAASAVLNGHLETTTQDAAKDQKLQKWIKGIKPAAGGHLYYWQQKVVRRSTRRNMSKE